MATDHNFKVKKGLHVLGSEGIYLTDTNTRLHEGSGNALRISTDSGGYVDLGSMNSGWVHMQMNKNLYILPSSFVAVDGNLQPYNDSQRTLGANDKRWSHIYGDALTTDEINVGSYTRLLTGASNSGQITFNADWDGSGYVPDYSGASYAGMAVIKMAGGGYGRIQVYTKNSGTTGTSQALSTFTKVAEFHDSGYFDASNGLRVGGSAFADTSRNITAGTISSGDITTTGIQMGGSTILSSNRDMTNIKTLDVDPDANGPAFNIGRYTGQPNIKAKSDDGGYLIMDSNGGWAALNWYTANNVALCQGGGNVGIGTTSVSEKLHVSGNIRATGTVRAGAVTYPSAHGTNGQVLTTTGSGTLTWTTVSSGTATTINSNADNRVITGSNTANTLNAESVLKFDGNHLLIGSVNTTGLNAQSIRTTGKIDISDTTVGAFRLYDGSTFRGGIGGGQWATGDTGQASNFSVYATGSLNFHSGSGSTPRAVITSGGDTRFGTPMIIGANEAFDTTNLALHVHGNQAIERNNALFLGVTGTNYNSWQAKLHNSGSTFYLNAQTFQFDNTGYGSDVFFLANSSGLDIRTGGLRIGNTDFVTSTKNIHGFVKNFATSHGWRAASAISSAPGYYGGNFGINGSSSENEIIYSTLPDGSRGLIWNTPSNDTTSNADGGWGKAISGLPSDDMSYMSVVYVRRNGTSTNGNFYHGCSGSHTLNTSGSANGNPYFISPSISTLPQDVWCVSIGFIRGNSDSNTSTTSSGGVYRCDTGEKIHTNTDFRMKDGSTEQTHRTYLYYATNTASSLSWAKPGFYAIDGTEPSVQDLIRPGANQGATFNDLVRINSTNNNALYINGNGGGLRFQGGNNRIYFNGYRALEGATDGGTLQIGENYSLALLQASNTQLKSGAKLYFNGGTTYGIGAGGNNLNSGYFDTVESGINTDTLELCYYSGEGVRVGTAAAHKYLYAGAIRSYAQSAAWDANLRLYSSDGTNYWNILCDNGLNDTLRFAKNNAEKFRIEDGRTYSPQYMQVGDATAAGYATNDGSWGARLNVSDSVHSKIEVSQEANSMRSLWYAHTGHDTVKFGTSTNHGLELWTNSTARINIANDGLIDMTGASQINLTDGYEKVTINGNQFLSYGAGSHLWLISNAGAANSSRYVELVMGTEWDWDDQIQMRYIPAASGTAGGVFRLGQTSKNSATYNHTTTFFYFNGADRFKFENDGDFIATGNITAYGSTSDIRLKENIEVIADPIEKVCKLKGITFNYKEDGKRSTGLIAQDLEQVLPEAVYETEGMEKDSEDTYKAIRYGNVVGLLVEAIKEQQEQIEALKNEINSLKGGQ